MDSKPKEIRQLEERLIRMLQPKSAEWDAILSLIERVEEHSLYRELGHPNLSSWLRKVGIFSRLKGGEFRYDPKTHQTRFAG